MSDILDRSLNVIFDGDTYVLNFTMKNILKFEENTNRGVFGRVNEFYSFKFSALIDLIACMLEDKNGVILSDFVYGLKDEKKMKLVADLSVLALTCFSQNVWGDKTDEKEDEQEDKKKD